MKVVSILFVLLLTLQSKAQDEPAYLNKSWKNLVSQIQRRNDVATLLLIHLNKTITIDSTDSQKAKGMLQDFSIYLGEQMTKFDSNTVRCVFKMNQNINSAMGKVLILLEKYPSIRQISEISALLLHLDGTEKRLQTFKQQHNELATKYRRSDLAFYEK